MKHMTTTYTIVESPDDGGYYAYFWDVDTGKDVPIDGNDNTTPVSVSEREAKDYARNTLAKLRYASQER